MCRPLSKNKAFRMTKIIQTAKVYNPEESMAEAAAQRALEAAQASRSHHQQSQASRGFAAGPDL